VKGWLIERSVNGRALWWCPGQCTIPGHTTDASKAVRFARKEDAELVRKELMGDEAYVTEHVWQNDTLTPAEPAVWYTRAQMVDAMDAAFGWWADGNDTTEGESFANFEGRYLSEIAPAPQPVDLSGAMYVPGAMCKKHLIYYKTRDGGQNKTVQHCPKCDDENNPFLAHLTAQATPQVVGSCGWSQDEWSESWSAGCGCEWVFPDGGPAENDMKYCPSCGKPVSLPAPPTKGASRE